MIKVGDKVMVGPRMCGCKPRRAGPYTVTNIRLVKPHKRDSECNYCGQEYEILKDTLIAELDGNVTRYPLYRLTVVESAVDRRLLLV